MRPVNLLPEELRSRAAGEGDPRVAYGVVGGLGLLLVMVLLAIFQSNKATRLQDETAALQAEATRYQSQAKPVQSFNDFADVVQKRTLLVGGLSESRFPWDSAMRNLSRSMPEDVTLDKIDATTAGTAEGTENANAAAMDLTGCASSWVGLSRFMVRMRNMPGVKDVTGSQSDNSGSDNSGSDSGGSDSGSGGDNPERIANCGIAPVKFTLKVVYEPQLVNLVDLPKVSSAQAAGAPGATAGTPAPASATTSTGAGG
ncbi:MAG: hypothetical protein HY827_02215 [Actinobacteria bacterium]|nr:hypothetical protein [Actinomycetota bacterium]